MYIDWLNASRNDCEYCNSVVSPISDQYPYSVRLLYELIKYEKCLHAAGEGDSGGSRTEGVPGLISAVGHHQSTPGQTRPDQNRSPAPSTLQSGRQQPEMPPVTSWLAEAPPTPPPAVCHLSAADILHSRCATRPQPQHTLKYEQEPESRCFT